jgi:chemotaxis protein MotB
VKENSVPAMEVPIEHRKRSRTGAAHGGAWKVAYADLVTAMMALFIVLWVMNQDPKVIKAVSGYFKDPHRINRGASTSSGIASPSPSNTAPSEMEWRRYEEERFEKMAGQLMQELSKSPELQGLMDQIKIEIVQEGLRIEISESSHDAFFEIGTAQVRSSMSRLLETIAGRLKELPNKIIVEGHTDSRPYSGNSPGYTNFELSVDRASAARRVLNTYGLSNAQIEEIRGYADSHLKDSRDPLNEINRRISVIVKYSSAKESK